MGIQHIWVFSTYVVISTYGYSAHMGIQHIWVFSTYGYSAHMGIQHIWVFNTYGYSAHMGIQDNVYICATYKRHVCMFKTHLNTCIKRLIKSNTYFENVLWYRDPGMPLNHLSKTGNFSLMSSLLSQNAAKLVCYL